VRVGCAILKDGVLETDNAAKSGMKCRHVKAHCIVALLEKDVKPSFSLSRSAHCEHGARSTAKPENKTQRVEYWKTHTLRKRQKTG
jgi:hypothetical protein